MNVLKSVLKGVAITATLASSPIEAQLYQEIQRSIVEYGGVQIGNDLDLAPGSCYIGTLGAFINDGSVNYLLSNNHGMARQNNAVIGEDIMHAFSRDCFPGANPIHLAELAGFVNISTKGRKAQNFVDLAIARPILGSIAPVTDENGLVMNIDDDGPGGNNGEFFVSNNPLSTPALNLQVKKTGRTTGLTHGQVLALGATIRVGYDGGTATFYDQIGIQGASGEFSAGGDSGSLIVSEIENRPVGLLFAGNTDWTFANPIGHVISALEDMGLTEVNFGAVDTDLGIFPGDLDSVDEGDGGNGGGNGGGKGKKPRNGVAQGLQNAMDVLARNQAKLLDLDQAVGVAVGLSTDTGNPTILIFAKKITPALTRKLPAQLEGLPVEVEVTGEILLF